VLLTLLEGVVIIIIIIIIIIIKNIFLNTGLEESGIYRDQERDSFKSFCSVWTAYWAEILNDYYYYYL
jgi:hypothetical protein